MFVFQAYEIERLETFHNPLSRTELQFDQDTQVAYTNWKLYDMNQITNKAWQEYGRLAWFISPDLAVGLYYTYMILFVSYVYVFMHHILVFRKNHYVWKFNG